MTLSLLGSKVDKIALLDDLLGIGMDINLSNRSGQSWFYEILTDSSFKMEEAEDDDDIYYSDEEFIEAAKLLLYYGAKISDSQLKTIHEKEKLAPLREALKTRERAVTEFLKDYLKELEALKPLSMDLINLISSYPADVELTPQQLVDIAHRCLKIQG